MRYDQVGIDTIRFVVPKEGFRTWLDKKAFTRAKVNRTPLTSGTLKRKLAKDKSIRVVKINSSYPQKLSNYMIVGKAKKKRYYTVEIAGLHQPTNGNIVKETYEVIAELLEKYVIESVDYAIDFLAINSDTMRNKQAIAEALSSEISKIWFTTTYFAIGADYSSDDPIGRVWERDSKLYWKAEKERAKGRTGLNNLWYRFEFCIDNNSSGFREPHHTKPKAWNKSFLMGLKSDVEQMPILNVVAPLSQTTIDYGFLDKQLVYFIDGRVLRFYRG